MASTTPTTRISVDLCHVKPEDPSLPALAVQVTQMIGSYMLWVGITEDPPEEVASAPLKGNLARDWACAMPSFNVC
jgi:proteasome assembly chaperone 4